MNYRSTEKRTAIVDNNKLVEVFVEGVDHESIVGNIYKGRVEKVVPGMQAAFVSIGLGKNGFLPKEQLASYKFLPSEQKSKMSISSLIHEGQEIIVQVSKDVFGEKGPRLTTLIELPGRYVVYLPNDRHIAISKKMNDEQRKYWRNVGESLCSENEGVIFRTACIGEQPEVVQREVVYLQRKWAAIKSEKAQRKAPQLLFDNASLEERIIRDITQGEEAEIIVDDSEVYQLLKERLGIYNLNLITLTHYFGKENVFSKYEIDQEMERLIRPYVWLKNGASLMIEQTEALTVIDVNTGKFTGKYNVQETIIKTNELAAVEIARQLRLRNIGGMVLIDFINMEQEQDRDNIKSILIEALKADRGYTRVYGFTQLGLLEMTRKKERKSLLEQLTVTCPTCNELGRVYSSEQVGFQIERALLEYKGMDHEAIWIEAPETAIEKLTTSGIIDKLEMELGFKIFITGSNVLIQSFEIRHIGTEKDVLSRVSN